MKLRELFEDTIKTAVVAFGRMNPPTIGHEKLVGAIKKVPGDHFLFLSHTQNHKTDPLTFDQKLKFASAFFPGVNIGDASVRTIIDAMKKLEADGYKKIVYVAGSDRLDSFESLLTKYNGTEYNFDSINVVNAGARDPDAEGAEGMSASKMRAAATGDNFEEFARGVPKVELADELFQAVKLGMVKAPKVKKMKAKEFVGEKKNNKNKPVQPNPVAKNAMAAVGGGGFGSHKDKKAAMKRGDEKHKKNYAMTVETSKPFEESKVNELKSSTVNDYISKSSAAVRGGRKEKLKFNPLTKKTAAPSWKVAAGKVNPNSVMGKYAKVKAGDLQGVAEDDDNWSVEYKGKDYECYDQDHAINKARKFLGYDREKNACIIKRNGKPVYSWRQGEKIQSIQDVAEGSGKNVVKSVKVGNFRHDLVDTGMGWQVRIYNGDELYDTGMSKNSEQKGLAALEDAVAYTEKQTRTKRQGVAEGSSYQTDSMVSHISQIIRDIYPQGGDKNSYMKLVAREMPSIVKANPKLFRRAFGIAYDRFFHIGQDDDDDDNFDYTDYSMRQGERGMEEGKQKGVDGKACWKGYKRMGTKKKGGKTVDNCVKMESISEGILASYGLKEVSPPGFKGTVKAMKKHPELTKGKTKDGKEKNPWALAWHMKNKGYKSHKKADGSDKD